LRFLVVLLGAIALVGCASRESPVSLNTYQGVPNVPVAGVSRVGQSSTPTPAMVSPESFSSADYRISPFDQLRIDVFNEPELSLTDLPVNPNGSIVLPLAGEIMAEGRTPAELGQQIAASLRNYIREPAVAVNVTEFNSQSVTVEGAVRMPGMYPATDQMSLMDTIALGQGLTDYSREEEILVFRRRGDQRYVARFDLGPIQAGQMADPAILPGDIVVVGQSETRRLFADALAVLPAAVGIFIALIQ